MTKLTRLRPLIKAIIGNNLTGMIASWLFVFPAPVAIWLGCALLEDSGFLPEPVAVYFVVLLPIQMGIVLMIIFHRIKAWADIP